MIRRFLNGGTHLSRPQVSLSEYIGQGSERRELKHLSSVRKRKQSDSLSSGERTGKSLNLCRVIVCICCGAGVVGFKRLGRTGHQVCTFFISRIALERAAVESDSLVS
jgi:hypothetical protein